MRLSSSETADLLKRLGDERRTEVLPAEDEFAMEDMIPDTDVVVTSTVGGYIKRVTVDTFRAQNRGGRGVVGISNLKREDVVSKFFVATTHQHVLFFTNKGPCVSSARLRNSRYDAPSARYGVGQSLDLAAGRASDGRLPDFEFRRRALSRHGDAPRRHQEIATF